MFAVCIALVQVLVPYYSDYLQVFQEQLPHEHSPPEAHMLASPATLRALAIYVIPSVGCLLSRYMLGCVRPNMATYYVTVGSMLTGCTIGFVVIVLSEPGCCPAMMAAVQAVLPSSFWININISAWPRFQLYCKTTFAYLKLVGVLFARPLRCILAGLYWVLFFLFLCHGSVDLFSPYAVASARAESSSVVDSATDSFGRYARLHLS